MDDLEKKIKDLFSDLADDIMDAFRSLTGSKKKIKDVIGDIVEDAEDAIAEGLEDIKKELK